MSPDQKLVRSSDSFWSWLFPLTYLLHFAEEYWGGEGYPAYLERMRGISLAPTRFLVLQCLGFVLVTAGVLIAKRLGFVRFMLVTLGALFLGNGLSHSVAAVLDGGYGPGLATSLAIWIPLGTVTLVRNFGQLRRGKFWTAVVVGTAINLAVLLITLRGGRLI